MLVTSLLIGIIKNSFITYFRNSIKVNNNILARLVQEYDEGETQIPYFPAHKTHCDFFVRNFGKK